MRSSYARNQFSHTFIDIVCAVPPSIAVEIGVLDGYSAISIAKGLAKVDFFKNQIGHLFAYDLWEDYKYRHGNIEDVQVELKSAKIDNYVTLLKMDAFEVHKEYEDNSVGLVHIDISNDGDILKEMVEVWTPKLKAGGIFLFEGGSEERDRVEWMMKYEKKPIRPEFISNKIIQDNYMYGVYSKFPSMIIARKDNRLKR